MHIITRKRLIDYAAKHPNAAASITSWHIATKAAKWQSLVEVRKQYPHADLANVASNNTVTIFNIAGNHHRLITSIHYNTGIIYILNILTHAQYSKNRWKKDL